MAQYVFLKLVFWTFLVNFVTVKSVRTDRAPPNFVYILTDDQDLMLNGLVAMKKSLNLIGDRGKFFVHAFVNTPICCPSRSTILTGKYPHNIGVFNNSLSGNCSSEYWQKHHEPHSMAAILKAKANYTTFYAGKYLNQYGSKYAGGTAHVPKGYDWWIGLKGNSKYYNYTLSINGTNLPLKNLYLTDLLANYSLAFLNQKVAENSPFFMMVAPPASHSPFIPPKRYIHKFPGVGVVTNPSFNYTPHNKHWIVKMPPKRLPTNVTILNQIQRRRLQTLLAVDDLVERIVLQLKKAKVFHKTYFIINSDNGFHIGQFGQPWDKRQPYEADTRVPLLISGPGVGKKILEPYPVSSVDIAPTILDLAGIKPPHHMDGKSFKKQLLNKRNRIGFKFVFMEYWGEGNEKTIEKSCPWAQDDNLAWLDCVHQLILQFPVSFEFSHNYLIKLAQHTYSNLFGTFLCNTQKQRMKIVLGRTFSVWEFLSSPSFKNHLYAPQHSIVSAGRVLWPKTNVRDLRLWSEVYLGSMEANFSPEEGPGSACPGPPELNGHPNNMAKTRSYGDLMSADACHAIYGGRRSSDPSINRELKLLPHENSSHTLTNNHDSDSAPNDLQSDHDTAPDFLPSDLEDNPTDCNQDCIFNTHAHPTPNLTDDQIDGLDFAPEDEQSCTEMPGLISGAPDDTTGIPNGVSCIVDDHRDLTNGIGLVLLREDVILSDKSDSTAASENESTRSERGSKAENDLDVEGFLVNNNNSTSSQSEGSSDQGSSEEKFTDKGVCKGGEQVGKMLDLERSVETSTETLVSEQLLSGYPLRMLPSPNGWDGSYLHNHTHRYRGRPHHCQLGEDGLMPLRSPVQERLDQILEEQRRKVELLEKELHASRQILIKQACHKCQAGDCERQDDSYSSSESRCSSRSSKSSKSSPQTVTPDKPSSVVESVNSASEGQASAGESLRSDMSWVAVEEGVVAECQGTLWVPDHAVSRCTGCGTEFWLGRRRHHCRKCGKIFCADCSEHATPLPSEQLYNPVRVCSGCYSELRFSEHPQMMNSASELPPDRCKRETSQGGQRVHTQIAASSN